MASRYNTQTEKLKKIKSLDNLSDEPGSDIAISQRALDAISVIRGEIRKSSKYKSSSESLTHSASSSSLGGQTSDSGLSSETGICPIKSALSRVPTKDWPILYWKKVGSSSCSLVQELILRDKASILRTILKLCTVNLNYVKCSQEDSVEYPLHLACRVGFPEVINVLLDHGASLTKTSCVTPPPGYNAKNGPTFRFSQFKLTPLWHALLADQVSSLEVLLTNHRSSYEVRPIDALKEACSASATNCVKWLLQKAEASADFTAALLFKRNVVDLMTTLISLTTNPEILEMLKTNTQLMTFLPAVVTEQNTTDILQDQLYRVYSTPRAINLTMATEFFLSFLKARAYQSHIDRVLAYKDEGGNNVLHILVQRHNNLVDNLLQYEIAFDGGLLAAAGRKHFLKDHCVCIANLIKLGAQAQTVNQDMYTAADALFPTPRKPARPQLDPSVFPRLDLLDEVTLDFIVTVLRQLFGADSKLFSGPARPQLLHHACRVAAATFSYQRHYNEQNVERIVLLFEILLKRGLDPNYKDRDGKTPLYHLIYSVWYGGVQSRFDPCYLKAFNQILACFLEHGLNILDILPQVNRYYLGGPSIDGTGKMKSATYMCELVGMLRDTFPPHYSDLGNAERKQLHNQLALLVHTFFRYGCYQQLVHELLQERYLPGANVEYVCSSILEELLYLYLGGYSTTVTKFNEQYLQILLHLLHVFVPHAHRQELYQAIELKLQTFDTTVWNGLTFWRERVGVILKEAFSQPSTLKQLCRLTLLQNVGWSIQTRVPRLPLPPQLVEYVQFTPDWQTVTNQLLGRQETDV